MVIRVGQKNVRCSRGRQVHPGGVKPSAMRTDRPIDVERGIDQGAAKRFGRHWVIEGQCLSRNGDRRAECLSAIEGAVEHNRIRRVIVPPDIDLPVWTDRGRSANRVSLAFRIVNANGCESSAIIARGRKANASAYRTAYCRVPGDVNIVAKRTHRTLIGAGPWSSH